MINKKWKYYLSYVICVYALIFSYIWVMEKLKTYASVNYSFPLNPYIVLSIPVVASMLMGALIGIESLYKEVKKDGSWRVDKERLIFVGLPALYLSMYTIIYFFCESIAILPGFITGLILKSGLIVQSLSGILLGYVIVNCFRKSE